MTTYYTSDQHWFHKAVVDFENRPFESMEEMNEGMIEIWNETVKPSDVVNHLGDMVFGSYDNWTHILDRLNGKIILHKGNHDGSRHLKKLAKAGYFEEIQTVGSYKRLHGYQLWLTHYPMDIGHRPNKFSISGHIHSTPSRKLNQINIGVDSPFNHNRPFGKPVHSDELVEHLNIINPQLEELFQKEREFHQERRI